MAVDYTSLVAQGLRALNKSKCLLPNHGLCGSESLLGGLGAAPHSGVRDNAPGGGVRGKTPEAKDILALRMPLSYQIILKFIASCYAFDY